MAKIQHKDLPEAQLHEPKGMSTASAGDIYVADGAGSGTWATAEAIGSGAAIAGQMLVADGSGGITWEEPHGWSYYLDNTSAQTFTTTASKLSIDGAGSATNTTYMPTGVSHFWDTTNDKILPARLGDSYQLRLDLPITAVTGSASILELELDIGGGASPTIVIVNQQIDVTPGVGKTVSISFGYFALATFLANGGQIFLKSDANTIDVTAPAIFIQRVSRG